MDYKVKLIKCNNRDVLRFYLTKEYDIDLNSDDQEKIKELFYELILLSFENEILFDLDSSEHDKDLFYDISFDYLKKLEEDLKTIRSEIPEELKDEE